MLSTCAPISHNNWADVEIVKGVVVEAMVYLFDKLSIIIVRKVILRH